MANNVNFSLPDPESTEQFEGCCNLLNLLGKLALQSAHYMLGQYEHHFEDDFRLLDCCDMVRNDCYCRADYDYPDYDADLYRDDDLPLKDEKV